MVERVRSSIRSSGEPHRNRPGPGTASRALGDTNADATSGVGRWAEDRAFVVALKPVNAGGAKGRRKMKA